MQHHPLTRKKMPCTSKVGDKSPRDACFRGSAFSIGVKGKDPEKDIIRAGGVEAVSVGEGGKCPGKVVVVAGGIGEAKGGKSCVCDSCVDGGDVSCSVSSGIVVVSGGGGGVSGSGSSGSCDASGSNSGVSSGCGSCVSDCGGHGDNNNKDTTCDTSGESCGCTGGGNGGSSGGSGDQLDVGSNPMTAVTMATSISTAAGLKCKDVCSKSPSTPSFQIKRVLKIGEHDNRPHCDKSSDNCTICGNDFFERASIMLLTKNNSETKDYECELCGKTYPLYHSLSHHVENHVDEKLHRCDVCGKDYFKSSGLEAHMKTHTGETPFHCDICSLDFACVFTLEMHTKTQHTDEKPFHCELCGKDFVLRTNLKMHIKMHMGEKMCNCNICKKNLLINSLLENHLQNHKQNLKERPFYYELKGKDFSIRMHFVFKMTGHKALSSDKLPVSNDTCKMEIPYKVTLQIQIQNGNGEKAFHSSVCDKDPTIDTQFKEHTPKRSLHFVKCIRKVLRQIPFHHSTSQDKK